MTTDCTPRYVRADPVMGGRQAVAEAWRNLTAVGARPLAVTDNMNFGNPEKPAIMGQFVGACQGLGEACRALDFPVVSGNVSLYNETEGRAIPPTPTIGGVGVLDDLDRMATVAVKAEGEAVLLVGAVAADGWLGQSLYLRELCGREEGAPPPVDLDQERRVGDVVRGLIAAGRVSACHDVSDGGLLVALAEMALAGGIGMTLDGVADTPAALFGEDQGRYVVTVPADQADAVLSDLGTLARRVGTTGGDAMVIGGASVALSLLRDAHEGWLPGVMGT
jgi:phosphoribosylformylglycinamidine synthase